MHCSLIMHGFHNGKWLILCSKKFKRAEMFCCTEEKFRNTKRSHVLKTIDNDFTCGLLRVRT